MFGHASGQQRRPVGDDVEGFNQMSSSADKSEALRILQRDALYADMNDRMKHYAEIQAIAMALKRPVPEIAPVYEEVLAAMKTKARIMDFLPILTSKKVRHLCKAGMVVPGRSVLDGRFWRDGDNGAIWSGSG